MNTTWMKHLLAVTLITLTARGAEPVPAPREAPAKAPRNSGTKPGITDIQYFAQERSLKVQLANGRSYVYTDVPPELAEQFAVSERKQEFLDRRIRPEYDEVKRTAVKEKAKSTNAATPPAVKTPAHTKPSAKAKEPVKTKASQAPAAAGKELSDKVNAGADTAGESVRTKSSATKTPAKETSRSKAKTPAPDKAMK